MFCTNCGKENEGDSKFCVFCGAENSKKHINEAPNQIQSEEIRITNNSRDNQSLITLKSIVLLLVSSIITVVLTSLISIWLNFSIYSFSLWFIIPVGGALVGFCGTLGYYYGLYKSNVKFSFKHYALGTIFGLISYLGIFYFNYSITYLDSNNNVNFNFEGDPISSFVLDGVPITFLRYIEITEFVASTHTIYTKYNHGNTSYEASADQNKIEFYLRLIASLVGGFLCGLATYGKAFYCPKCHIYGKTKNIMKMAFDEFDKISKDLEDLINNPKEFTTLIQKFSANKNPGDRYIEFVSSYCPKCLDGYLAIVPYVIKDNKAVELSDNKVVLEIPGATVGEISQIK